MSRPSLKHLIIISSSILLSLIIILAVQLKNDKKISRIYTDLISIDSEIDAGFYTSAKISLDILFDKVFNKKTAIMFLKRADKLSKASKDYSFLMNYSSLLFEKYKNDPDLSAIYTYSLQKINNFSLAQKITEQKISKSSYYPLHLINILNTGTPAGKNDKTGFYAFAFNDAAVSIEDLLTAADQLNDERFLLDASIRYIGAGDLKNASKLISRTASSAFSEFKSILAYDTGEYSLALEHYFNSSIVDFDLFMDLFGCDVLILNGLIDRAADKYKEIIEKYPAESGLAYRNLYSIYNDYSVRFDWLNAGLKIFPNDDHLLISSAWESYLEKDFESISQTINKISITNSSLELFKLNLKLSGGNPEHIIANFWNIFNNNTDSQIVTISFANFLLKNKQSDQLSLLLKRYISKNGTENWVFNYLAVSEALRGNYKTAELLINDALAISDNIVNNYNYSIILSELGRYQDSKKTLEKALRIEDIENSEQPNLRYTAKIYYRLAETSYNMGEYKEADIYLDKLFAIKAIDMKASLLQKKIQEKI